MKSLRKQVSQLLMWGFESDQLTPHLKKLLRKDQPGGVILFKRNIRSTPQVTALNAALKKEVPGLLIGVDQEGGRVARIHDHCDFPPAATYGELYERQRDVHAIEAMARLMGWELHQLGFNLNFAPVLDVNSNPKNPIIGDRAFSSDPNVVVKTALPFARGLLSEKIIACGKHFPGHGDTRTDSHLELPRVTRSRRELQRVELVPFRAAIAHGIPMLMTAHVVYQDLDSALPATLSRKILNDLLRRELRFRGVIVSDDLFMKALARYSLLESLLLGLEAGVDLFLLCRDFETRHSLLDELVREVAKSSLLRRRVTLALARVRALKKKYLKKR